MIPRNGSLAKEAIMRTIGFVGITAAAIALTSTGASAANGSWCATYTRGVENCVYSSYAQCQATASGLGGTCEPNPFPGSNFGTSAGSWGSTDQPRRSRRNY
jgi:hypothetical protein